MKLTNTEITNAKAPLEGLLKVKMPVKTSFALAKLAFKINEPLVVFEKVREGLVKTYGKPDPNNPANWMIEPGDENWGKFMAEYGELLGQEVELVFEPVVLPDSLDVEPAALMALEKFVTVA